jgi:hypothetical protein
MHLADDEREVLKAEVAQALEQVRSPEMRATYTELLAAVDGGEVPEALLLPLEALVAVGLESGRIRRVHTAHGEMAANRIFSRTPRGKALRASASEVNEALKALAGQTLEEVSVAPSGPSAYTLTLGTEQGQVLLRLDRHGVRVQSLEVGG